MVLPFLDAHHSDHGLPTNTVAIKEARDQLGPPFLDVNGDGYSAPSDPLRVINALNSGAGTPYVLEERNGTLQQSIIIGLGQQHGLRVYSFEVEAGFDTGSDSSGAQDRLDSMFFTAIRG